MSKTARESRVTRQGSTESPQPRPAGAMEGDAMSFVTSERLGPVSEKGDTVSRWAPSVCMMPGAALTSAPLPYPTFPGPVGMRAPTMKKTTPSPSPYAGMFEHGTELGAGPSRVPRLPREWNDFRAALLSSLLKRSSDSTKSLVQNLK